MRVISLVWVLAASALVGSCSQSRGPDEPRFSTLQLVAGGQNRGNIGQASLTAQGAVTGLNIFIGGVPAGVTRPLQVYSFIYAGRCGQLAAQPRFALNSNVRANAGNNGWYLRRSVPLSLAALRAEPHALVLRSSPANRSLELFCGDIE